MRIAVETVLSTSRVIYRAVHPCQRHGVGFSSGTLPSYDAPGIQRNTPTRGVLYSSGRNLYQSCAATMGVGEVSVEPVPCLNDNYSWLVHDHGTGKTAVVDPAEEGPVVAALKDKGWTLFHILNTHHHWDHTGANEVLKERFNVCIVGPKADQDRIPGIDVALGDGDEYMVGDVRVVCYDTPGHTRGHITFHLPEVHALFPGDTLFSMGCGRLFEGTPEQMWASLSKLVPLDADTRVYCAHEYTLSNATFAMHIEPHNAALQRRWKEVEEARSKGIPTIPSVLGVELETNPFLRPQSKEIRASLGIPESASDAEAFGVIRRAKDSF